MSIEKIIKDVEHIKDCCDQNGPWAKTLGEAIALLRTHPDAQPNEPLTPEELRDLRDLRDLRGAIIWQKQRRREDGEVERKGH